MSKQRSNNDVKRETEEPIDYTRRARTVLKAPETITKNVRRIECTSGPSKIQVYKPQVNMASKGAGESFNDWVWGGGDVTTILFPGRSPKQPLPGLGLHDPLHDRKACSELNSLDQEVG